MNIYLHNEQPFCVHVGRQVVGYTDRQIDAFHLGRLITAATRLVLSPKPMSESTPLEGFLVMPTNSRASVYVVRVVHEIVLSQQKSRRTDFLTAALEIADPTGDRILVNVFSRRTAIAAARSTR